MDKGHVQSLINTLEFLDAMGAGDAWADQPSPKATLDVKTARNIVKALQLEPKAPANQPRNLMLASQETSLVGSGKNEGNGLEEPLMTPSVRRLTPALKKIQSYVDEAIYLAKNAKTLPELEKAIRSFDGCALKHTAMNTVFSDGNPKAGIMLIGEAPGADEDRLGKPFVGLSGQLLDRMFQAIGYDRSKLYISNILPWRPPGNRQPTKEEASMCLPFIERHIELVQPKILIFVGGTALKTLLRTNTGITKLRGHFIPYHPYGDTTQSIQATAIFHPAYILRSPAQKRYVWMDLLKIKVQLESMPSSQL